MSQPYLNKGGEANVSTGCARKVTAGVVGKLELPNSNSKKRMMTRNMSVFGKIIFFQVLCSKNGLSQNIDCKGGTVLRTTGLLQSQDHYIYDPWWDCTPLPYRVALICFAEATVILPDRYTGSKT